VLTTVGRKNACQRVRLSTCGRARKNSFPSGGVRGYTAVRPGLCIVSLFFLEKLRSVAQLRSKRWVGHVSLSCLFGRQLKMKTGRRHEQAIAIFVGADGRSSHQVKWMMRVCAPGLRVVSARWTWWCNRVFFSHLADES
jgi:hypothetical protein